MYRVLKSGKYLTVTFHNADIGVYNQVIRSIVISGFNLEKIIYQPPARASAKTLLAPYGSAEGDYYIRFLKPQKTKQFIEPTDIDDIRFENLIVHIIKHIISERGEPVTYNNILKIIYIELDRQGYLTVKKTEDVQKILEKHEKQDFVFIENEGWWFKNPEEYLLDKVPLHDRVELLIIQLLRRRVIVTFDDILREIFTTLPNGLTPETTKIKAILEEYAIKIRGNKWSIKDNVNREVTEHSMLIGLLSEIGKKLNYKLHVGKREQSELYNDKPLMAFNDDVLIKLSKQIEMIDLLWIKKGKICYAFEVEYSTGITEAIIRGSYIDQTIVKKIIVIPKSRERLLISKIKAPIIKEKIIEDKWRFLFFQDVFDFSNELKGRKVLDIDDFDHMLRDIKDKDDSMIEQELF
jgi:hypothetical protein